MMLKVSNNGNTISIRLPTAFGFSVRNEFRQATSGNPAGTKYILDFQEVVRMDSSALGMMLLLRETSGSTPSAITLMNLKPEIRKIIHLANFQDLFNIV